MKNMGCIFAYWSEVYRKAFVVSLREGRRPAKQSKEEINSSASWLCNDNEMCFSNTLQAGIVKKIIQIWVIMILALGLTSAGFAETINEVKKEAKGDKEEITDLSVMKEIEGEVSAVDKHGIAVVYSKDLEKGVESEIYIPLEKENIKMVHKRNIEDIQVGDTVKVEYEIVTEETKEGQSSKFEARTVTFLRAAQKKPLPPEPPETEDESDEGVLPFKGIE